MDRKRVKSANASCVDLTHKEVRNAAWWERRRDRLRQCHNDHMFNERSLVLCWKGIRKSKRFNREPLYPTDMFPSQYTTRWHQEASRLHDRALLIFHPRDFPSTEEIKLLMSTLSSFTDRLGKLIDGSYNDRDRERASFDSLSFPVIKELLYAIKRYTSRYELLIPKRVIPDYEMLDLSLATLHRAKQFFEYFLYEKSAEAANYLKLSRVLQQDCENIDMIITVVQMVMHKSDRPVRTGPKKKRPSESVLDNDHKRIKVTLSGTDMVRKVHTNTGQRTSSNIKQEPRPLSYSCPTTDMDPDSKMFVVEGIPSFDEVSETQLIIKSEKMGRCVVPGVTIKNEPLDTWTDIDFRSLSEF